MQVFFQCVIYTLLIAADKRLQLAGIRHAIGLVFDIEVFFQKFAIFLDKFLDF